MSGLIDLSGKQFGSLTVLHRVDIKHELHPYWQVRCECNREYPVAGSLLRNGCASRCMACSRRAIKRTRPLTKQPEYVAWRSMLSTAARYGANVCPRWGDFEAFLNDMGPKKPGAILRRTNKDRPYEPGNVEWTQIKTAR